MKPLRGPGALHPYISLSCSVSVSLTHSVSLMWDNMWEKNTIKDDKYLLRQEKKNVYNKGKLGVNTHTSNSYSYLLT